MRIIKRGSVLLLGAGTSFLLILAGTLCALVYVLLSEKGTFYLSSYFTGVFFVSVFCGGYAVGKKGGIRNWFPAGLVGLITGGMVLLLFYVTASFIPGLSELLIMLFLPTLLSSTGALVAANRVRKLPYLNRNKLTG